MSAPYVLVDEGSGCEATLEAAALDLARDGWRVMDGLDARPALGRIVLRGTVATGQDAASALLAALDGFGLLVRGAAEGEIVARLVDDLRRLGHVDHRIPAGAGSQAATIGPEGRAILALLAEGHTLGEAAGRLGLSRRTADRRLAEARAVLGVTRTTEAIARAARNGWLRPDPKR